MRCKRCSETPTVPIHLCRECMMLIKADRDQQSKCSTIILAEEVDDAIHPAEGTRARVSHG
jgi:hypothetical protein